MNSGSFRACSMSDSKIYMLQYHVIIPVYDKFIFSEILNMSLLLGLINSDGNDT